MARDARDEVREASRTRSNSVEDVFETQDVVSLKLSRSGKANENVENLSTAEGCQHRLKGRNSRFRALEGRCVTFEHGLSRDRRNKVHSD